MNKKTLKEILDSTEVADMIAVESMKWHYNYYIERQAELLVLGAKHHLEEFRDNEKYIDALKLLLGMYGERL